MYGTRVRIYVKKKSVRTNIHVHHQYHTKKHQTVQVYIKYMDLTKYTEPFICNANVCGNFSNAAFVAVIHRGGRHGRGPCSTITVFTLGIFRVALFGGIFPRSTGLADYTYCEDSFFGQAVNLAVTTTSTIYATSFFSLLLRLVAVLASWTLLAAVQSNQSVQTL